jgi:hypothetical protein
MLKMARVFVIFDTPVFFHDHCCLGVELKYLAGHLGAGYANWELLRGHRFLGRKGVLRGLLGLLVFEGCVGIALLVPQHQDLLVVFDC